MPSSCSRKPGCACSPGRSPARFPAGIPSAASTLVAPPILALEHRGQSSPESVLAAQVFLAARVVYFPAYVLGVRILRTAVWLALAVAAPFLTGFLGAGFLRSGFLAPGFVA